MNSFSIVIVSGLSGAGKSNASKVLEDLGYNTIDNIPLQVVEKIAELFYSINTEGSKVAFVIDSRSKDSNLAYNTIKMLKDKYGAVLLFMEASSETLVKRYKETRRKHPQGDDLIEAINIERTLMSEIKNIADIVFNSDGKNIHELSLEIQSYFNDNTPGELKVFIESFGFKYGVPSEADLMFDVRFLRNPYFVESLRLKTGLDSEVRNYVMQDSSYKPFTEKLKDMLSMLIPLYTREGKKYLTIAIGCTGGKHRSVTVAEDLGSYLECSVKHRDIEK